MRALILSLLLCSSVLATGARTFDGANDYFYLASAGPVTGYPFSIAGWFNAASAATGTPVVFSMSDHTVAGKYYLTDCIVTGTFARAKARNISDHVPVTTNTWTADAWHHVVAIVPDDAHVTIYLDGDAAHKGSYSGAPGAHAWVSSLDRLSIGCLIRSTATECYWKGSLSQIGLWDIALSEADIANLYNNKRVPGLVEPEHLKAWWKLDEANATDNATDAVGAHTFTLTEVHSPGVADGPSGLVSSLAAAPALYHFRSEQ